MITVILFAVTMILGTGLLTKAISTQNISRDQVVRQQGYYVAKSALDVCKAAIEQKDSQMIGLLKQVLEEQPTIQTDWEQFEQTAYEYQVTISRSNSEPNELMLEAISRCDGVIIERLQGVVSKKGGLQQEGYTKEELLQQIMPLVPAEGSWDGTVLKINHDVNEDIVTDAAVEVMGKVNANITAQGNIKISGIVNGNIVSGGNVVINDGGNYSGRGKGTVRAAGAIKIAELFEGSVVSGDSIEFSRHASSGDSGYIYSVNHVITRENLEGNIKAAGGILVNGKFIGESYSHEGTKVTQGDTRGRHGSNGHISLDNSLWGNLYSKRSIAIEGKIHPLEGNAEASGICAGEDVILSVSNQANICVGGVLTVKDTFRGFVCGGLNFPGWIPLPEQCLEPILPGGDRHHHAWCYGSGGQEEQFVFEKYQ
ncbi:MAG: hypothetical protein ACRCTE_04400 [Cellulosilyticaceae bacterium]